MPAAPIQLDAVKAFLNETSRGILITRRKDGGVQSSPMAVLADDEGNVLLTTRRTAAKVKNLTRDPYAAVTVITERFRGAWMQVEGNAHIEFLPDALPALADFYARRSTEDTHSEAFRNRMIEEGRCLIRIRVNRVVQPSSRSTRPATRS
jgi:PPOX class probable F420-dependent enzyme